MMIVNISLINQLLSITNLSLIKYIANQIRLALLWSERPGRTRPQNAMKHWQDHRRSFPEIYNAKGYVEATKKFTSSPPTGTLQYTRKNGEIIFYHSESNTFAVVTKDNIPKTMMKPRHKMRYWENKIKEDQ